MKDVCATSGAGLEHSPVVSGARQGRGARPVLPAARSTPPSLLAARRAGGWPPSYPAARRPPARQASRPAASHSLTRQAGLMDGVQERYQVPVRILLPPQPEAAGGQRGRGCKGTANYAGWAGG